MSWVMKLDLILHYRIFSMAGQPITPVELIVLTVIFLTTIFAARSVRGLLEHGLLRNLEPGQRYTFARLSQYLIWALGIMAGLKVVNINLTAIAVVAGALGVGIGFGLQNLIANFFAGLMLLFERPIKVGDRVTVQNVEGDVAEIKFRSTTIVSNDNIAVIVPNSQFVNQTVINWSYGDTRVRLHIPVGVAYGSDLGLVTDSLLKIAAATDGVLKDPAPAVRFREFGDSSLNLELLVWTDHPAGHFWLQSRLNFSIDADFRHKGIEIPFPQRDLHIKRTARPARVTGAGLSES